MTEKVSNGIAVDFDPFSHGAIESMVPVTEAQQEIWLSTQLGDEANCAFNESLGLELTGALDVFALERAVHGVVDRHESLRATFSPDGKFLCIQEYIEFDINRIELKGGPREVDKELHCIEKKSATQPFDLVHGPLVRFQLIKMGMERHVLLFTAHHIICDGWSFWVVLEDLTALYNAAKHNVAPEISAAESFSQYAKEISLQDKGSFNDDLKYWIQQFTPVPAPITLPTFQPRPRIRSFSSERLDHVLDDTLVKGLTKISGELGVTFISVFLTALAVYLHRICGQDDIVIGVPSSGQAASGRYRLVGHCVNLLPLRCRVNGEEDFRQGVKGCGRVLLDGYEHQQVTYGTLVRHLDLKRDQGHPPLVSLVFNMDQDMDQMSWDELDVRVFTPPRCFENFEWFLNIVRSSQGIVLECQYNSTLFQEDEIWNHLEGIKTVLSAVVEDPDQLIRELPAVSPTVKNRITSVNETKVPLPNVPCFINIFQQAVERYGDKTAAVFKNSSISYTELDRKSNRLALKLRGLGVGPGILVGIYLTRSLNMLVATLGVLKAGGGYVPLDPGYPRNRLQYMIDDSELSVLITEQELPVEKFTLSASVINVEEAVLEEIDQEEAVSVDFFPGREDVGYVIYTSGSTGKPKGVQVTHENILNFLLSMQKKPGIGSEDILLAVTTLSFDIAVLELYLPLISGATVVIASSEEVVDGTALASLIDKLGVTLFQATPSTWRLLLAADWQGNGRLRGLCGGEPLPKSLADELLSKVAELWNMYGPTETTVWSTVYRVKGDSHIRTVLIGAPIDNTSVYVLDKYQQSLPPGVPGELYIGGTGVTRGYLNRPDLTEASFLELPVTKNTGERVYRTGDLVRFRRDGNLEYLGRLDNQVKLRGHRIELGEVENAISSFLGISEIVVAICRLSDVDERLVAYIRKKKKINIQDIKKHLQGVLPGYMIPGFFVLLETFPYTANGKIDRKNLPLPVTDAQDVDIDIQPRDDFERSLLAVWRDILNIPNLGVTDNFFEAGGHSLLALTLVKEMKKATGIEVEYGTVFTAPTVRELVDSLGKDTVKQASSIIPLQRGGTGCPLFFLCGINLYRELALSLGNAQPVYAIYADEEQALLAKAVQGEIGEVSIQKLAWAYCEAILRRQPHGPYQLGGISFGGILAIETAKLLQARGEDVHLVVLLDTVLRNGVKKRPGGFLKHQLNKVRTGGVDYLVHKAGDRFKGLWGNPGAGNDAGEGDNEAGVRFRELAYLQAMDEYEHDIVPYSGNVLLVRALDHGEGSEALEFLPGYGWEQHVTGDFTVIDIPGDHLGIIRQPNVRQLAEKIQKLLL